ncbi:S-adenosyl-L-methionine-dependent methyltransferase [Penicillium coprophilum]|uniref:S-adenosyl-L-methionine-dependent methyltransferase n=1 Tax=Penicillium coprophilum TaxID=36646 RepID=UPI0023858BFF|nr:S-adenosyl-L-methionine-dependent methyltransferase [Penicillium coprophilum]KAJ5169914.1 S-adenosyl-L-methionine-dependent methyltransferase [Penicillium coprophilum]
MPQSIKSDATTAFRHASTIQPPKMAGQLHIDSKDTQGHIPNIRGDENVEGWAALRGKGDSLPSKQRLSNPRAISSWSIA